MRRPSKLPPLVTGPLCPMRPQIDPVRLAVFLEAAERTRPFFEQHRAAEARRPKMPTDTIIQEN